MSCPPPISSSPPGLIFEIREKVIEAGTTYENDLSPVLGVTFGDPFPGPIGGLYSYAFSTLGNTKTLTLIGASPPVRITWNHYSIDGTDEPDITTDEVTLTPDDPSYTWPKGTETPGTPPDFSDYSADYDRDFTAHRVV